MRCWPTDSALTNWLWARSIDVVGHGIEHPLGDAQASAAESRLITWSRMPNRRRRPASAARLRIRSMRSATWPGVSPQVR